MKPYMNLNGKGKWAFFWGDKVPKRMRKIFKKSGRRYEMTDISVIKG